MGVGAGLYHVRCRRKKFTFAISSPDEFLLSIGDCCKLEKSFSFDKAVEITSHMQTEVYFYKS